MTDVVQPTDVAKREHFWRTRDGRRIPLSEMHDRHLQNTERFLRGGGAQPRNVDADYSDPISFAVLEVYGDQLMSHIAENHQVIRAELQRRGLPLLPDHPRSLERGSPVGAQPGRLARSRAERHSDGRVHEAHAPYAIGAPSAPVV